MKRVYIKHQMSCAKDRTIEFSIDHGRKVVEATMEAFDSVLFGAAITGWLAREENVVAFRDDNSRGWIAPAADYKLFLNFSGIRFQAQVVRLFQSNEKCAAQVTVILDAKNVEQRLF